MKHIINRYMNIYINIYYIWLKSREKKKRDLDSGEQRSSVFISELWFWFCKIYCKEETFLWFCWEDSFVLVSLIPFMFFVFVNSMPKPNWVLKVHSLFYMYNASSFHFILKAMFLLLFNFPLSPLNLTLCSSLLCNSLKKRFQHHHCFTSPHHSVVVLYLHLTVLLFYLLSFFSSRTFFPFS